MLGVPIFDRKVTQKEALSLTDDDLRKMGFETHFWSWYFQTAWTVGRLLIIILLAAAAVDYGASLISGASYEYRTLVSKLVQLAMMTLIAPFIIVVVSYTWWYALIAVDRLR
jgi:hypothetical protein